MILYLLQLLNPYLFILKCVFFFLKLLIFNYPNCLLLTSFLWTTFYHGSFPGALKDSLNQTGNLKQYVQLCLNFTDGEDGECIRMENIRRQQQKHTLIFAGSHSSRPSQTDPTIINNETDTGMISSLYLLDNRLHISK